MKLVDVLRQSANPSKAKILQRFFKTGKGQYGEGDVFLGLTVPESRTIAKQFSTISLREVKKHLDSKVHEERLIALFILIHKYEKDLKDRKDIFEFYLDNKNNINNWDLVDSSADKIVGRFLFDFGKNYPIYRMLLRKLAESSNLWERRIAIVSTFYFIKQNSFEETIKISEMLLRDKEDLIHKAVGWMLREVGKRDKKVLDNFLVTHHKTMPRTMLRYAIEKHSSEERKNYMS
jgi:3-methyladenine DNA glycosylase AlkD